MHACFRNIIQTVNTSIKKIQKRVGAAGEDVRDGGVGGRRSAVLTPKGSKQKKETTLNISVFTLALTQSHKWCLFFFPLLF